MDGKRILIAALVVILAQLMSGSALAVDVGQEAADQVDYTVYRHYLDDLLYTHDGDDRGPYGAEHDLARENIVEVFESFGLDVQLQHFTFLGDRYNVIATQTGSKYPDSYFLIGAHYDSVHNPGADDNASGVALVLEVARVLSQYDTEYSIKYVAFDMEEWGLYGSHAYADAYGDDDILGMISIDMISYDIGEYATEVHALSENRAWRNLVIDAVNLYGNDLLARYGGDSTASDHAPFEQIGVPACLLIEAWGNPCYHQQCDSVDTENYINYDYALDHVRGLAGLLAVQAAAYPHDCDGNNLIDDDEIAADPQLDCNVNGLLDVCEFEGDLDCNSNGISDICDIHDAYTSEDCDGNNVPDECENTSLDCNGNGEWDPCDIMDGVSQDCNANLVPDSCEVADGSSDDCNMNSIPDECELGDCNINGILDECDIRDGYSHDADSNGIPDECEDSLPPQPNPMCFDDPDGLPRPLGTDQITMTAAAATDNSSGIEYLFAAGSGSVLTTWQAGSTLVVSNLNTNWPYSYKVKARDTSLFHNETAYSTPVYWTATAIETPSGIEVSDVTATSLQVRALGSFTNLNFGESGLYFELTPHVEGSGANEWTQNSAATSIVLNNLSPCTEYALRVKARNFYGSRGGEFETAWTQGVTVKTPRLLAGDCNCDYEVDYDDVAMLRAAFATSLGDAEYDADADVDGNGVIDCDDWQMIKATWTGRRVPLFEYCGLPRPPLIPEQKETGALFVP